MKHYEITVRAVATVFVADAKSEQDAYALAREVLSHGDFDDLEMTAEELKTPEAISSSERHANAWSKP